MSSSLVHLGLAAASGLVLGAAGALTLSKPSQATFPPPQQQQQQQAQPPAAYPLAASRQGQPAQVYAGSLAQGVAAARDVVVHPSSIGSSSPPFPSLQNGLADGQNHPSGPISDILTRQAYTAAYDRRNRIPAWTAEHLTKENLKSGGGDRGNARFEEDGDVPELFRAKLLDYFKVRFSCSSFIPFFSPARPALCLYCDA